MKIIFYNNIYCCLSSRSNIINVVDAVINAEANCKTGIKEIAVSVSPVLMYDTVEYLGPSGFENNSKNKKKKKKKPLRRSKKRFLPSLPPLLFPEIEGPLTNLITVAVIRFDNPVAMIREREREKIFSFIDSRFYKSVE